MQDRIKVAREDSGTTLFLDLVRLGEMVMKVTTATLVAAVVEDRDRHRYRQLYSIVRANGLGPWDRALNEVLTGPTTSRNKQLPSAGEKAQQALRRPKH